MGENIPIISNGNFDCKEYSDTETNIDKQVKEYRRRLFLEFTENVTLHGFQKLVNEKGMRKVSWILVITISISFAVYLFYHILEDYGHETVLEYELQDGGINMDFPTVTICTNSPAYTEVSLKNFPLKDITLEQFKNFYIAELSSLNYLSPNTSAESSDIIERLSLLNITTYKDVMLLFHNTVEDTGYVWKDFVGGKTCFVGGTACNFSRDFRETSHWTYSLCHQWNYYDPNRSPIKQSASEETWTMLINIHANYKLISYYPFYGLVLYIHPYGTPHHLAAYTDSVGLQSGVFTSVDVGKTEVNLLPVPYSTGCGTKVLHLIKHFPYTRALCEVDCVLKKVYDKCGCVAFDFEGQVEPDITICNIKQMKCYHKYIHEYKDSCLQYASTCPRECIYYKYNFQQSLVMNIGDEVMYEGFKQMPGWNKSFPDTETYIQKNLLGFEMGYKSLSQLKEIYKPSVSFGEVVGVVGGSIGLCLGFSFVTGYEILFFLYDYITVKWNIPKHIRNRQNGNV